MANTTQGKTWVGIPAGSRLRITGRSTSDDFVIFVDSDDGTTRRIIAKGDEVIPGPCGHRLDGGKTYIDRIIVEIFGDPGPTVDVIVDILDSVGKPIVKPFGFSAAGSAGSPYMVVLNIIVA